MFEPAIAVAASPRDWAHRLQRHVAEYGGARLRATILHQQDALEESFDVFLVDDITSFLTRHLVSKLHQQGRRVLGIYDRDEPWGKGELLALGADRVVERAACAEDLLAMICDLAADREDWALVIGAPEPIAVLDRERGMVTAADKPSTRGMVTAVGGPSGCGATEIAIGLASAVRSRGESVVLIDADEATAGIARRLGIVRSPRLSTTDGALAQVTLAPARCCPIPVRSGLVAADLRSHTHEHDHIVIDVGEAMDASCRMADAIVAVGVPTPGGMARMLEWAMRASALAGSRPVHLVLNQAPASAWQRAQARRALRRSFTWASLTTVPSDPRVREAGWAETTVPAGPFTSAVGILAAKAVFITRQEKQ